MATNRLSALSESASATANAVRKIALRLERDDIQQRLLAEASRWSTVSCVVAVLGPPGAGKTSLVNAISGIRPALPVDDDGTRSVTVVRHGSPPRLVVSNGFGRDEVEPTAQTLQALTAGRDRLGGPPDLIEVHGPAIRLFENMQIVDTPGVNGVDGVSTRRALRTTETCDGLVFVVDATRPIGASELDLLEEAGRRTRSICVVVTKIDRFRGWRTVAEHVAGSVRSRPTLADATVITFSSTLAEAAFDDDIDDEESQALMDESGLTELQAFLFGLGRRLRQVRLGNFLATTAAAIDDLEEERRAMAQVAAHDGMTLAFSDVEDARRALAELRDEGAGWLVALGDSVARARDELVTDLQRRLGDYSARADDAVRTLRGDPGGFAARVAADLELVAEEYAGRVTDRVDELIRSLVARSDLDLARVSVEPIRLGLAAQANADNGDSKSVGEAVRLKVAGSLVSAATSSSMLITMASGDAGAAALIRIGALGAATIFSGALAAITIRSDRNRRSEQELRTELRARIDAMRQEAPPQVRQHLLEVQRLLEQQVRRQLRERAVALEQRVATLQSASRAAEVERRRLAARAEEDLRQLATLRQELDRTGIALAEI